MKLKKVMALIMVIMVCVTLGACGDKKDETKATELLDTSEAETENPLQNDEIVIGVSLLTLEHVFYQDLETAIQAKADELGVEVIIEEAKNDLNTQYAQIQDFVTLGVDAILLAPVSTAGSSTSVDLADDADIPVFTIDNSSDSDKVIAHVAADNYLGGQIAAQYMAEKILPEGGNVVLITDPNSESTLYREQGFEEWLEENPDANIEILAATNADADTNTAMSVMQDMFTSFGDEIDAVYTVTDGMGFGVKSAIEAEGSDIKIVSFTGNPQALAYIAEDTCFAATMRQDPDIMGGTAIENIVKYLNGEDVEKVTLVEPYPVDISNVNDYLK